MADAVTQEKRDKRATFLRHFNTFMLSLVVSGIVWWGNAIVELKASSAAIKDHVEGMDVQLSGMYRAEQARRDVAETARRLENVEQATSNIDRRVDGIEIRVTRLEAARQAAKRHE